MKLPKIKKPSVTFLLILFLALIAGALVAWRVFLAPKRASQTPAVSLTPTPTPKSQFALPSPAETTEGEGKGDSPEDLIKSLKEKFPLVESVPFETDRFKIDYRSPLTLEVKIKIATQEAAIEKEVQDWLWSKGVNPSTHKIDWITP